MNNLSSSELGEAPDPLQMLISEHELVRQLFMRFLSTDDIEEKQEIGPRILALLDLHAKLEETVFYPAVQTVDASLITHCVEEHRVADQLIEQLKETSFVDQHCHRLMQQLQDAIMRHVETEENRLFPMVRSSSIDLEKIALQMLSFETMALTPPAASREPEYGPVKPSGPA